MNPFFWTSGHLSWGLFSALVFSGVWLLVGDLAWRLLTTRAAYLVALLAASWAIGVVTILLITRPIG